MTVPAALRELEKIEMVRRNNSTYKLDHAVTRIQKTILSSFGLDDNYVKRSAEEYSRILGTAKTYTTIEEESEDGEGDIN